MKVSRPQQRMKPVEKWGKPAANDISVGMEAPDDDPWYSLGDKTGSDAEVDKPRNWSEPSDSAFRKEEPSFTVLNENKTRKGTISIKIYNKLEVTPGKEVSEHFLRIMKKKSR